MKLNRSKKRRSPARNRNPAIELDAVLDRVAELGKAKSDAAIARYLQMSPQTLATAKRRGTIPFGKLCDLAVREAVSLDWLLLGRAPPLNAGLLTRVYSSLARLLWDARMFAAPYAITAALRIYERAITLPRDARLNDFIETEVKHAFATYVEAEIDHLRSEQTGDTAQPGARVSDRIRQLEALLETK